MTPQPAPVAQAIESLVVPSAERLAQLATNRCIAQQWPLHGREWVFNEDGLRKFAEAIVSDVPAGSALPQGWVAVPVLPTTLMLKSVDDMHEDKYVARGRAIDAWQRMLAALPPPPKGEQHG